ncbi:MAG: hypothetical protein ACREOZ_01390, partial [Gloeomargaritales cyanobacterium]
MNQSVGDCSTWYQEKKVRPEPGVGPSRRFPSFSRRGMKPAKKLQKKSGGIKEEEEIFKIAIAEMDRQNEFNRTVRYLKAARWFQSLPKYTHLEEEHKRMHNAMIKRKELLGRLRIITARLSDNRKDIIMVSRNEEKKDKLIGHRKMTQARTSGNLQRHSPVRRSQPPIQQHHNFGGRCPLPSNKCFQAYYHPTSQKTTINGRKYKRMNGFITPEENFLRVGNRVVMDEQGQHAAKQVWRTYREYKKEQRVQDAAFQNEIENKDDEDEVREYYGTRQSPQHYVHAPPKPTESSDDIFINAASVLTKLLSHIQAPTLPPETIPASFTTRGNLKDDNDPKYSGEDEVYEDDCAYATTTLDEIDKIYDDSDDDSFNPPRKMEWAYMTSVTATQNQANSSTTTNKGNISDRFRRLFNRDSPPQAPRTSVVNTDTVHT